MLVTDARGFIRDSRRKLGRCVGLFIIFMSAGCKIRDPRDTRHNGHKDFTGIRRHVIFHPVRTDGDPSRVVGNNNIITIQ